ncbi:hypothetical protein [Burkholderia ubonensis]|uniref:Uncharacterized protein n=1 Tax=Burkholderia ubonensis subsp. mesacidophila TaxID=265293 RepID=A0A2A4FJ52_9BURK|nr:hypothetical protein [Burkholderia ubonensis]PCE32359.1 hypothetical protein BZL54_10895 [Burkholderia ubonensis subsp. mesacidophila]
MDVARCVVAAARDSGMKDEATGAGRDQAHEAATTAQEVERDPDGRRPDLSAYAISDGLRSPRASNIVFSPDERRASHNID